MVKVLVVGQTPPPFGGQAIMVQNLLERKLQNIKLYHVRMAFSSEMDEIGRFRISKILHLIGVIIHIIWMRFFYGIQILYYPPAGPNKIPMYRDFAILILTRVFFSRTIFHFHAGGISKLIQTVSPIERWLAKLAYFYADCSIRTSTLNPEDGKKLKAKKDIVIPNGIKDNFILNNYENKNNNIIPTILFVSVLNPAKGVDILIDSCILLKNEGLQFKLELMGRFCSEEYEKNINEKIKTSNLSSSVTFLGVKTGDEKWEAFKRVDIFCFPSYFESESFGLVALEAMQFELPVVATHWRGIPSVVRDGENGYLVPIKNVKAVAGKLRLLLDNTEKRKAMGKRGREIYLQNFTLEKWYERMEEVFMEIGKI